MVVRTGLVLVAGVVSEYSGVSESVVRSFFCVVVLKLEVLDEVVLLGTVVIVVISPRVTAVVLCSVVIVCAVVESSGTSVGRSAVVAISVMAVVEVNSASAVEEAKGTAVGNA